MADVDIKQVVKTLTKKFKAHHRFIFWFDDEGEFKDSVDELTAALADVATVVKLEKGHQLATKLRLLNADRDQQFLIYSPQGQPPVEENHLRDMVLYSDTFKADAQEILRRELKLPENLHHFVKDHTKFFGNKERRTRFMKYDLPSYQSQPTEAIMASLVHLDQPLVDFFDILRLVLKEGITDNQFLIDFEKYDVLTNFWQIVAQQFGFEGTSLVDLSNSLYITMAFQQMALSVPSALSSLDLSHKSANVQTFMQQFSASVYRDQNDQYALIASQVWRSIVGEQVFGQLKIDDVAKSDVFSEFDDQVLNWIQEQLLLENDQIMVNGLTIGQLTKQRREMHYGRTSRIEHLYLMVRSAWQLIQQSDQRPAATIDRMITAYTENGYYMDTDYRHFIFEYQQSGQPDQFLKLKQLIENYYVDYLSSFGTAWNDNFEFSQLSPQILQRNFYKQYIGAKQNRIVVIISDSLRFEVGKELENKLSQDSQVTGLKMQYLISGLPSVTYMGMAALLPHRQLHLEKDERQVLVDGNLVNNVKKRSKVLQEANPRSVAYRYKELLDKTRDELRAMFVDQEVIYIYHNQIDTMAENQGTEDETFVAADEAITELNDLILRLRTNSINHIYVTADHGYLYRDAKLAALDKIEIATTSDDWKSPRYLISNQAIGEPGIKMQSLGEVLDSNDSRYVYTPTTANVFKANGSDNYVHGGSSLQEMVVPLLEIKTTKRKSVANVVQIQIVNTNRRITSLEVPISVMQTEAISAKVKPAAFKLYFVDGQDHQISGQTIVNANRKSNTVNERIQNIQVILVDQNYERSEDYYLVVENIEDGSREKTRYTMDIAAKF